MQRHLLTLHFLPPSKHPSTMNSPMSQRPHATQSQRPRCFRVLHMVSNQCDSRIPLFLFVGFSGVKRWGGAEGSSAGGEGFGDDIGDCGGGGKGEIAE
jgi:hypothetical protein